VGQAQHALEEFDDVIGRGLVKREPERMAGLPRRGVPIAQMACTRQAHERTGDEAAVINVRRIAIHTMRELHLVSNRRSLSASSTRMGEFADWAIHEINVPKASL